MYAEFSPENPWRLGTPMHGWGMIRVLRDLNNLDVMM
jgi:hypothetical protein